MSLCVCATWNWFAFHKNSFLISFHVSMSSTLKLLLLNNDCCFNVQTFFICRPCPVLQASRQALSFKYFVLLLIQKVHPKKNVVILCAKVLKLDVVNKDCCGLLVKYCSGLLMCIIYEIKIKVSGMNQSWSYLKKKSINMEPFKVTSCLETLSVKASLSSLLDRSK